MEGRSGFRFWEEYGEIQEYRETGITGPDRMRVIDANARALGLSDQVLMEGAGQALASVVRRFTPKSVLILCGPGKNGGDGMVTARILAGEADVTVCWYEGRHVAPATLLQVRNLQCCAVKIRRFRTRDEILALSSLFSEADLIVDALLGTGSSGDLREPLATGVSLAAASGRPIVSADIPTPGITPAVICAFHQAKTEGAEVFSIGIPVQAEICTGPGDLLLVPDRSLNAHKGDGGSLLVIGGGPYQGAPYLAGMAALRAGADIVRVASPVSLPAPDLIHEPMSGERIGEEDTERLARLCSGADVVVCGPGLGDKSHQVITAVSPEMRRAVFDADALRLPLPRAGETIYTPHAGEFARMTGRFPGETPQERARAVREAGIAGVTLLKGPVDVISTADRTRFNLTGTPAMTTGGTGDVLAGVCGALLTRLPAFEAACIAAYCTGRAGEIAAETSGYGMTAQDLLSGIPRILYSRREEQL